MRSRHSGTGKGLLSNISPQGPTKTFAGSASATPSVFQWQEECVGGSRNLAEGTRTNLLSSSGWKVNSQNSTCGTLHSPGPTPMSVPDSDLLRSGIVTLPNLCTPEHLVLRGTYNSLGQEYATLVTWPADATCRRRSATCPPSRSKASYLPVTRQETELRVRLGEARGAIRVDKDLYDTRTPNTEIGEIGNSTAAT